jgi:hypothetical protein
MSLIYGDSFQDDEDLCNILAALHLESRPVSADRDLGTVVAYAASGSSQHTHKETPASRLGASLAFHNQPLGPNTRPSSEYLLYPFCVLNRR